MSTDQAQANVCEPHHFVWTWPINDPNHGSIGVCDLCGAVKVDGCRSPRAPVTADRDLEAVTAVLGEHQGLDLNVVGGKWVAQCQCGVAAPVAGADDAISWHQRHQAAAVLPLIREREAAWAGEDAEPGLKPYPVCCEVDLSGIAGAVLDALLPRPIPPASTVEATDDRP